MAIPPTCDYHSNQIAILIIMVIQSNNMAIYLLPFYVIW